MSFNKNNAIIIPRDNAESEAKSPTKTTFCRYCGSELTPHLYFCPYCGKELVKPQKSSVQGKKGFGNWIRKNMRTIRIGLFILTLGIQILTIYVGSQMPLEIDRAEQIVNELQRIIDLQPTPLFIFQNNIAICLLCFLPLYGILHMVFIGINGGIVISAIALVYSRSSVELFLSAFLLPYAWMEWIAFSLGCTHGVTFLLGVLTGRSKKEGKNLLIILSICFLLIGLGAIIEITSLT